MSTATKYPRTFHAPWSLGRTDDDKTHTAKTMDKFFAGREVVVTEKADGENTTIYHGGRTHARSLDSKSHPSRDWLRAFAAQIGMDIPEGWRVCGENVYARHSIGYTALPSYFLVFGIYDDRNVCLSWDDTVEWCGLLGLQHVPVLYRGVWDEKAIAACYIGVSHFGGVQEGYVIRDAAAFAYDDFWCHNAKFVREDHVQTDNHWMQSEIVPNTLAK